MTVRRFSETAAKPVAVVLALLLSCPLGSFAANVSREVPGVSPVALPNLTPLANLAPGSAISPVAPADAAAVSPHPVIELINQLQACGVSLPETVATPADAQKLITAAQALPDGSSRQKLLVLAAMVAAGGSGVQVTTDLGALARAFDKSFSDAKQGSVLASLSKWGLLPSGLRANLAKRAESAAEGKVSYPDPVHPESLQVPLARLRWTPAAEKLPEASSGIQAAERKLVGQDRALNSIYFGLKMPGDGYNLYVSGPDQTGRETSLVDEKIGLARKVAAAMPTPQDRVSVTNIGDRSQPLTLDVPAGQGPAVEKALQTFLKRYETMLPGVLNAKPAADLRKKIHEETDAAEESAQEAFEAEVDQIRLPGGKFGVAFYVEKNNGAVEHSVGLTYAKDGKFEPITHEEAEKLINTGAFTEQEWEQAHQDATAAGKTLSDKYNEMMVARHELESKADEQIEGINLKFAQSLAVQLGSSLLRAVTKSRHDTPAHKAYEKAAEEREQAFALEAAKPRIAGKYGLAIASPDGKQFMVGPVQIVDGKIVPMEDEELQAKLASGELTVQQIEEAAAPLIEQYKALLKQRAEEHKAVHANDEPYSEDEKKAAAWVNALVRHASSQYGLFLPRDPENEKLAMMPKAEDLYHAAVLATNEPGKGAPVVFDRHPSLLGTFGLGIHGGQSMVVPGMGAVQLPEAAGPKIKAGTLLQANGGIWIAYAMDVLTAPGVWSNLMRFAREGQVEIFQIVDGGVAKLAGKNGDKYQIPAKAKIVLIGSPMIRMLLAENDESFSSAFNATAEFESRLPISEETLSGYLQFFRNAISGSNGQILEMTRDAIAAILEYAAHAVRSNEKLTAQFGSLHGLMREASFWAREEGRAEMRRADVEKALKVRNDSDGVFARHYQEMIFKGVEIFETQGAKVGQINGLAVLGDKFGSPLRVTIVHSASASGFQMTSPDNEAGWTGSYFKKSFADTRGFLENLFGAELPLNVKVQVSFEQTPGIDGDSATSTMMYGTLSKLSGVPIKQSFAVTGSADQFGNIQAIGGINEKIEGFFDLCKHRGLTGDQGIVMPISNVGDLMLKPEVVQAVREGKFHIYAVSNIKEGIEILTGVSFEEIYHKAQKNLAQIRKGPAQVPAKAS